VMRNCGNGHRKWSWSIVKDWKSFTNEWGWEVKTKKASQSKIQSICGFLVINIGGRMHTEKRDNDN
jgi:hypothetical protein